MRGLPRCLQKDRIFAHAKIAENYYSKYEIRGDVGRWITGTNFKVAHHCPKSELDWFILNNMQQYKMNLNSDSPRLSQPASYITTSKLILYCFQTEE
jgi:hypothetical protein